MKILFWFLVLAPVILAVSSWVYYQVKQNHFFPYAWKGVAFVFVVCWAAALYAHLWIIGKVA